MIASNSAYNLRSGFFPSFTQRFARLAVVLFGAQLAFLAAPLLPAANAAAMYSADATGSVGFSYSIDPTSNGTVITTTSEVLLDSPDFEDFFSAILNGGPVPCCSIGSSTRGDAVVSTSTSAGSSQHAQVSGSAGPSQGASVAVKFIDGWTTIDNSSGSSAIDVVLMLNYDWASSILANSANGEYAEAATRILTYLYIDNLYVDGIDLYNYHSTDVDPSGPLGQTGTMALLFTVGIGAVADIELFVAAQGFAQIPEPATLSLFGLGLAGLGVAGLGVAGRRLRTH